MKTYIKFLVLFLVLAVSGANAATISYQTRGITSGVNNTDYKASWASQTSTITTQTLNNLNTYFGGNNTFSHLSINFATGKNAQVGFQLAVDAGYGGAIYIDNALLTKNTTDLWWANNWANTGEILSASANNLTLGNHILEVFWAEKCCNGSNGARFNVNGGSWQNLSSANLNTLAPVPAPAAVWLFGSGIVSLLGYKRKKQG